MHFEKWSFTTYCKKQQIFFYSRTISHLRAFAAHFFALDLLSFEQTPIYRKGVMRKFDLAQRLARDTRLSPAQAAEEVDKVVYKLVQNLKEGKPASIPGLGPLRAAVPVIPVPEIDRAAGSSAGQQIPVPLGNESKPISASSEIAPGFPPPPAKVRAKRGK